MVSSIGKEEAESLLGLIGQYSAADLRRAYKRSAKKFHPDIAVTRGMSRPAAEEKMKLVNQANDFINALFTSWPYPEFIQSDYFGDEPSFNFDRIFDDEVFNGAYVSFGRYPGDQDGSERPISWYVIAADNNSALLISELCIDTLQFNAFNEETSWSNSAIRLWLNETFLSQAFSPFERKSILKEVIRNNIINPYGIHGGSDTADSVFFLNADEAKELFVNDADRSCSPTGYSLHRGIWSSPDDGSRWWLRSPGRNPDLIAFVDENGVVHDFDGLRPGSQNVGIRPCIRVRLERRTRDAWDLNQRRWQRQAAAESEKASKRDAEMRAKQEEMQREQARRESIKQEDEKARRDIGTTYSSDISVGSLIEFGSYMLHDSNQHQILHWRVLDIRNHKATLISELCIAAKPFHPNNIPSLWNECALKQWLNDDFLYTAFSSEDRAVMSPLEEPPQQDLTYVRLLSCSELKSLLPGKQDRISKASSLIQKSDLGCCDETGCDWWLMDTGIDESFAAYVYRNGTILDFGLSVSTVSGVRPVITINVK